MVLWEKDECSLNKFQEINPSLAKKLVPKSFLCFDVETRTIKDKELATYIFCIYYQNGVEKIRKEFDSHHPKQDFTRFLLSLLYDKRTLVIWAHNAQFDVRTGVSVKEIIQKGYVITSFSTKPFILAFKKGLTRKEQKQFKSRLVFLDTLSFFKSSIEKIGEFFGIQKILIDFTDKEYWKNEEKRKLLKERCVRDVETTIKICENIYNYMYSNVAVSAPQLAFFHFKRMLKQTIQKCNSNLAIASYYGGRVEVFRQHETYVRRYDINSMYPFVMKNNSYPVEYLFKFFKPSKEKVRELLRNGFGIIARIKANIPDIYIAPFPFRREKDKKIIYPIGKFETVVCNPEFKDEFDFIDEFLEIEVYRMSNIFEEFVSRYWNLRQQSTGFMNLFYKVGMLNSLYGKFAQISKITEFHGYYSDKNFTGNIDYVNKDNELLKLRSINGLLFKTTEKDRKYSTAISAFITSNARKVLYDNMLKYSQNLMYVDTDCLDLQGNIHLPVSTDLGGYKLEKEGIAQYILPKMYFFNKQFTIKGVPKDWTIEINEDNIIAKGKHFTGLLEAMRKDTLDVSIVDKVKKYKLKDDKRIWYNNESVPIKLNLTVSLTKQQIVY